MVFRYCEGEGQKPKNSIRDSHELPEILKISIYSLQNHVRAHHQEFSPTSSFRLIDSPLLIHLFVRIYYILYTGIPSRIPPPTPRTF